MKIPTPDIKNPKHVAVIVVGGVAIGLVWRQVSKRKGTSVDTVSETGDATADTPSTDLSAYALAENSTGNLGGGSWSSSPTAPVVDTSTTRDVGQIQFPVTKWVIEIGDEEYMTDGTNIELINPITVSPAPVPTPTPAPTPTPTPTPTFVVPSYNGVQGATAKDPLAWAYIRAKLDYPNETPQQWWNRAEAQRNG